MSKAKEKAPQARKETTVSEADKKAAEIKAKDGLEKAILQEAFDIESGKQHSVQQMIAYVRQLKKMAPVADKEKK